MRHNEIYVMDFANLCRFYSEIIEKEPNKVQRYLLDTQDLTKKIPDGVFNFEITSEQEEILRGFNGDTFELYKEKLRHTIEDTVSQMSGVVDDTIGDDSIISIRKPSKYDLPENVRYLSIGKTLEELIPHFQMSKKYNSCDQPNRNVRLGIHNILRN